MNYMRARQIHPFVDEEIPMDWGTCLIIQANNHVLKKDNRKMSNHQSVLMVGLPAGLMRGLCVFFLPWLDSHDTQYMFQIPYQMYVWTLRYVM